MSIRKLIYLKDFWVFVINTYKGSCLPIKNEQVFYTFLITK